MLEGRVILRADGVPDIRRNQHRLLGHEVAGVRTKGKHLLIDLDNSWTVHVWLGMPGRVTVTAGTTTRVVDDRRGGAQVDRGAIRLELHTEAGVVEVWSAPQVDFERRRVVDRALASLGPDVADPSFDWEAFSKAVAATDPARPVGDVLVDQRILAGIGNEYRNEILFLERHHPSRPVGELDENERLDLARRGIRLMNANVTNRVRVTTGDARRPTWVYGRSGKSCRKCGTAIESAHLGTPPRITFWCPTCQTAGSPDR